MNSAIYEHTEDAIQYARDVILGVIPACETIYNACQRFFRDISADQYVFDHYLANKACNFIQLLPHTKGRWAGKKELIKLKPWQKFLVCNIFGWIDKPGLPTLDYPYGYPGGFRRFRKIDFMVARKNGKSILAAAIGLYVFCENGNDFAPEVFSGATTEKQAMEVFKPARLMCLKTSELTEHYDIQINARNLSLPDSGGKFEPVIGNPGDGSSPSCWIVDEYHEHATSEQVDTATTGMGAREEPLLLIITTAGFNTSSPCYQEYSSAKKMLAGLLPMDEQLFALIYELDEDDDYRDPANWIKSNPNLGISVYTKYIEAAVAKAVRSSSDENTVLTKNFNRWTNAKLAWINSQQWSACGDSNLYEGDFITDTCIGAVDLSSRIDLTAFARLYLRMIEGERHYYVFVDHFLPHATIQSRSNDAYIGWWKDDHITACGENEIDFNEITEHVSDFLTVCNVREIAYDTWKASQLAQTLSSAGAIMVEYRQQVKDMTEAMKELEGAIASGRFHHANCPVLTWEAGNVTNRVDRKGNYFPNKDCVGNKIDGIVAVIMAVGRAMHDLVVDDSCYDKRDVREL
jgi:phage terminase large subunit-like protein